MGGGGFVGERPRGASSWCDGNHVVGDLNKLFHLDPTDPKYKAAKAASLALFQTAATTGQWEDLWNAYSAAYNAAQMTLCPGWLTYIGALGNLSPNSSNGGSMATTIATSSNVLTFNSVPDWMANGLNVSAGGITGGQTVSDFDATTVTLTANVNAPVNSGATIVFALPTGLGTSNIQAIAQARYDGLSADKKMFTKKHPPHDHQSSGHVVNVTRGAEITIDSPYIPPGAALRDRDRRT